jgi:hypothetical protein
MIQMAPSQLVSPLSMTQRQGSNALTLASHSPYSSLQTKNASSMSANPGPIQFGTFIAGLHKIKDRYIYGFIAIAVISSPIWVPIYATKAVYNHFQGTRGLKKALSQPNTDLGRQEILKKAITTHEIGIANIKRALKQLSAIQDPTHKGSLLLLALNSVGYDAPKDRTVIYKQVETLLSTLPAGDMRDKLTTITDYRLGKNNSSESYQKSKACEAELTELFGALVQTTEPETHPQAE